MGKVYQKFVYENEKYDLIYQDENIKCFECVHNSDVLVTNNENDVLFIVSGESSQNEGYVTTKILKENKVKQ